MVNIIPMLLMPISNGIAWYLIVQKSKSPLCLLSPLRSNVWKISFFYAVWALYNRYFVTGREGELGHYSFGLVTLMCLMTGSSFYNNMKWTKTSNNVVYAIKIPLLVSCGIVVLNFSVVIPMIISSNGPKNFAKKVWKIDDDDDDDDDDDMTPLVTIWGYIFTAYILSNIILWSYVCYQFYSLSVENSTTITTTSSGDNNYVEDVAGGGPLHEPLQQGDDDGGGSDNRSDGVVLADV